MCSHRYLIAWCGVDTGRCLLIWQVARCLCPTSTTIGRWTSGNILMGRRKLNRDAREESYMAFFHGWTGDFGMALASRHRLLVPRFRHVQAYRSSSDPCMFVVMEVQCAHLFDKARRAPMSARRMAGVCSYRLCGRTPFAG